MQERLRWTGHVLRCDDVVLYEVLTFTPEGGTRGRGRPRRRFYDTVKEDMAMKNIAIVAIRVADRKNWRQTVVN